MNNKFIFHKFMNNKYIILKSFKKIETNNI